uniref:Uncharacterized protein n=1 Tax=Arion vulgaris TaxID=1028688 RepID=A0A0B7BGE6_9EUPU
MKKCEISCWKCVINDTYMLMKQLVLSSACKHVCSTISAGHLWDMFLPGYYGNVTENLHRHLHRQKNHTVNKMFVSLLMSAMQPIYCS